MESGGRSGRRVERGWRRRVGGKVEGGGCRIGGGMYATGLTWHDGASLSTVAA